MDSAKNAGRMIALAFLVQVVLAPFTYFRWMRPATAPDFLVNAAVRADMIRLGMMLTFVFGAMTVIASLAAYPVVKKHSERFALAYVALAAAGFATLMADTVALRNLLALSIEFAKPGAPTDVIQTLATVGRANWISAHYTNLTIAHFTSFIFFIILLRFAFVPRTLAALGVITSAISTTTVASALVARPIPFRAGIMPVGIVIIVLILWLLARGLTDGTSTDREPGGATLAHA